MFFSFGYHEHDMLIFAYFWKLYWTTRKLWVWDAGDICHPQWTNIECIFVYSYSKYLFFVWLPFAILRSKHLTPFSIFGLAEHCVTFHFHTHNLNSSNLNFGCYRKTSWWNSRYKSMFGNANHSSLAFNAHGITLQARIQLWWPTAFNMN